MAKLVAIKAATRPSVSARIRNLRINREFRDGSKAFSSAFGEELRLSQARRNLGGGRDQSREGMRRNDFFSDRIRLSATDRFFEFLDLGRFWRRCFSIA